MRHIPARKFPKQVKRGRADNIKAGKSEYGKD